MSNIANIAIKRNICELQRNNKELATGIAENKRNLSCYIIRSSLRSSQEVLRKVHSSSSYGINLLQTAQNTLISIKDTLLEMRTIIAQANTSFGTNLKQLDDIYREKANRILDMLVSTQFKGRNLFDGSLANFGVQIPAQLIPNFASPLNIRVGEEMSNIISLSIPRLLTGDGTTSDVSVPGRFTPLFPMTNNAVTTIAANNLVINSPIVEKAVAMRNSINNNIPDTFGLNPIQDTIRQAVLKATDAIINKGVFVGNVVIIKAATMAALRQSGVSTEAINTVELLTSVALPTLPENAVRLNAYKQNWLAVNPHPNVVSAKIVMAAKNAIIAAASAGVLHGTGSVFQIGTKAAVVEAINDTALNISIGNLLTNSTQLVSDRLVSNSIDIVTSLISDIIRELDDLSRAQDNIDSLVTVLNVVAEPYFSTKYEDAAKEFSTYLLALQGSISTIAQAYKIAEATLELIKNDY